MSLIIADRVQETCTSPGTGSITLLGAVSGYQSFLNGIGNGNTTYYTIADISGANWEVGLGTYSSSGNSLARTTVITSSNGTNNSNGSGGGGGGYARKKITSSFSGVTVTVGAGGTATSPSQAGQQGIVIVYEYA